MAKPDSTNTDAKIGSASGRQTRDHSRTETAIAEESELGSDDASRSGDTSGSRRVLRNETR